MAAAPAATIAPGVYTTSGTLVYVGVEHELPDPAYNDFYEPSSGRTGPLESAVGLHLRCGIREERRVIDAPQGQLGVSLYVRDGAPRPTIILIHGSDAETREMGFLIPYFVCNGVNVLSYDQRGTGASDGNWFSTGPIEKADDVAALYDRYRSDRHVERRKIGVWGFSNGGWVAPLVALHRPIAFMILKSAPTESVISNLNYEVVMEMKRYNANDADIVAALRMWRTVEAALYGKASWGDARRVLAAAEKQSWFKHSLMPNLPLPPTPAMEAGLRQAISYDPSVTLTSLTTPALALYGALDRKVDYPDSSAHMRDDLRRGGARDVTVKIFARAGHTLTLTKNGYDADLPERYAPGYPSIMLDWLRQRDF